VVPVKERKKEHPRDGAIIFLWGDFRGDRFTKRGFGSVERTTKFMLRSEMTKGSGDGERTKKPRCLRKHVEAGQVGGGESRDR